MRTLLLNRAGPLCSRTIHRLALLLFSWALLSFWVSVSNAADVDDRLLLTLAESDSTVEGQYPAGDTSPVSHPKTAGKNLPKARSIDLEKPVEEEKLLPSDTDALDDSEQMIKADSVTSQIVANVAPPLVLLGTEVPPVTSTRLSWSPDHSFEGLASPTPVLVVNGAKPGPTLCLTAAIHGDELNGIEIVRRVLYDIEPEALSGSVIGVPIVNLQGFQRRSRYLTDRRDLNRHFPGSPTGSSAARIAYSFFYEVINNCSILVDIHTGSFDRTNLPQLRADLTREQVVKLSKGFGATVVLHNEGATGTLRRAAVESGIPAITLEVGGPMRLQQDDVKHSVKIIHTLLDHLHMVKSSRIWGAPEPVYYRSQWLRADTGGILLGNVELGEKVSNGDTLGFITNPITNIRTEVKAPIDGRVLGMALDQVVLPGFAAYHIGISGELEKISEEAAEDSELPPQDASDDDANLNIDNGDEASPPDGRNEATSSSRVDDTMEFD